jgi:hypothetical protein
MDVESAAHRGAQQGILSVPGVNEALFDAGVSSGRIAFTVLSGRTLDRPSVGT